METFLKKWLRCWTRWAGSSSSQNRWPAAVVGTSDAASTSADTRGALPSANAVPAASWTPALSRMSVAGSEGSTGIARCSSGASLSVTGAARSASFSGSRIALAPPTKNIEASIGRANTLVMAMR